MRYAPAIVLLCLALLIGSAYAQPAARQHLPVVRTAPAASICDGAAPIHAGDTGDLDAIRDADGRYIVAYQDRAHGSVVHVAEHVGAALDELPAPALARAVPQFSPDGPKQGSVALVAGPPGGRSRVYYTQRTPEDAARNEGPYGIWCEEF